MNILRKSQNRIDEKPARDTHPSFAGCSACSVRFCDFRGDYVR